MLICPSSNIDLSVNNVFMHVSNQRNIGYISPSTYHTISSLSLSPIYISCIYLGTRFICSMKYILLCLFGKSIHRVQLSYGSLTLPILQGSYCMHDESCIASLLYHVCVFKNYCSKSLYCEPTYSCYKT